MTDRDGAGNPVALPHVSARSLGPARLPGWVRAVIIACCLIEALLLGAALLGYPALRFGAFALGAFWSPVLTEGVGIYPGQPVLMFATHGFLHAGLLHLAMNMISLAALAPQLARLIGAGRMGLVYAAAQVAGAALFGVMQPQAGPMIGASGAVFGVAGALVVTTAATLRRRNRPTGPLLRAVLLILGLNLALTVLMPSIAWEAHLGGALAGSLLGLLFLRRAG